MEVFDFSYFLPWSQCLQELLLTYHKEILEMLFPQSGALGGPLPQIITAIQTNIDPFHTKRNYLMMQILQKNNYKIS